MPLLLQTGAMPTTTWELIRLSSPETIVVLVITAVFSLVGWFIIGLKWCQFRRINRQAERFFAEMERSSRLDEAYHAVMKLPPSPYTRLFREGVHFYNEIRPGALLGLPAGQPLQEDAVVRDHHDGAGIPLEVLLQPDGGAQVQVVGGCGSRA